MKTAILILILVFGYDRLSYAQSIIGKKIEFKNEALSSTYGDHKIYELNFNIVDELLTNRGLQSDNSIDYHLKFNFDQIQWNLILNEYFMMDENYVTSSAFQGVISRNKDKVPVRTFRGKSKSSLDQDNVALTLGDNFIHLTILEDNIVYHLESLNMFNHIHNLVILYTQNSLNSNEIITCANDEQDSNLPLALQSQSDTTKSCLETKIALACDYSMLVNLGTGGAVISNVISTLNQVQLYYASAFSNKINFVITEIYLTNDSLSENWLKDSTTDYRLGRFRTWAEGGGLNPGYDVATAWSYEHIPGDFLGRAQLGGICSPRAYNVCIAPSNNVNIQAHEIGHNFGAFHDGKPGMMNGVYLGFGQLVWSDISIETINKTLSSATCLQECVLEPPISNFETKNLFYCRPSAKVEFLDKSSGSRRSFYWEFPGGKPGNSTSTNPVVTYEKSGVYTVKLTVSNRLGIDVLEKQDYIYVDSIPIPNFRDSISDLQAYFFNSSLNEDHTYLWKFGDGSTSKDKSPIHKYKKDGEYLVSLQEKSFCGTKEIKQKVIISTVNFATDIIKGCSPLTIKFKNLSSPSDSIFNWSFPGGEPSSSTEENPVIVYKNYGQYNVSLKASNGVDAVSLTKKSLIEVDSFPTANFSVDLQGMSLNMINNSKYALSYTWDFGDGSQSDIANPNHVYTRGATFPIKLLSHNECGDVSQIQNIKVGPLKALFEANQKIGCTPFTVQYHNSSWNSNNVKWTFEGGVPSTSTDENPIIIYDKSGTYKVNLEASDGITTQNITEDKFITVADHIQIGFTETVSKLKVFFFNSTSNADTYRWDFGDGKKSSQKEPSHTYLQEGSYKVKLEVQNACESKIFEKVIEVRLVPRVDFTTANQESCAGNPVSFLDHSSTDVLSWDWLFEGGQPKSSNLQNPTIVYPKPGNYSVKLSVKNSNGTNEITKSNYINVLSPVLCPTKPKGPKKEGSDQFSKLDSRNFYKDIQILPNPNTGLFRLDGIPDVEVTSQISILNLCGQQIVQQNLPKHITTFDVDLMNIESGVYQLIFMNNSTKQILKFVIQR